MKIVINANSIDIPWKKKPILPLYHSISNVFYQQLFAALSYPSDAPPVAELLRRYHHLPGKWLLVTPLVWEATHNNGLVIGAGTTLELSHENAKRLFTLLQHFFKEEGRELYWHDDTTWLLACLPDEPTIHAEPPDHIIQQPLLPHLKHLDTQGYWLRKMTEIQMLLNERPANGVWIWGEGELQPNSTPIYVDTESILQLAGQLSTKVSYFDASLVKDKDALLIFDKLTPTQLTHLWPLIKRYNIQWYCQNECFETAPKKWFLW